jgi:AAHS family 4-hydroxybenzoate transporter-like MFS transporter
LLHFDLARDNVTARTANKTKERVSVFSLLSRSLAGVTISLWLIRFINAVVMFILLSWLPTMLKSIGWSLGEASRGSAMMQIGGIVGGVALSWLLDRGRATTALVTAFVSMIVIFLLFSQTPSTVLLWSILLVLGGGFSMGAHFALNALAATLYPQHMRATGAGWAGAMSRVGSIIGALVGGLFIHLGWGVAMTISLLSVPTAFSLLLTIALHFTQKRRASPKPILATEALQMP